MPPKKKEKVKRSVSSSKAASRDSAGSEDSLEQKSDKKKERNKPLTKKEKENLRKQEKAMREKIAILRKEADSLLAELKASEEATQRKNEKEANEHVKRLNVVTGVCDNFKMAKARLAHENNKLREQEIWERYTDTNQLPYPEVTPIMHTHMFLWNRSNSSENINWILNKCDTFINTLNLLNDLIDYPMYSTKKTISDWIEVRGLWRNDLLAKIDKACFNMIKNLAANFTHSVGDQDYILNFEKNTNFLKLSMVAYKERNTLHFLKPPPKVEFTSLDAEVLMPAAYRSSPFVLRMLFIGMDFLSDTSSSFNRPEGLQKEADLLLEVKRCFESKNDAKASVADREREKVRLAKQRVLDAQAAASLAEKSFETFQQKTKRPSTSSDPSQPLVTKSQEGSKKKKQGKELTIMLESTSEIAQIGSKRPKGVFDDCISTAKSFMQSEGAQRALDSISMKSGMKKKVERMKTVAKADSEEEVSTNVFYTHSMISISARNPKVVVKRASELCFEDEEDERSRYSAMTEESAASYDSLDMLFGIDDENETYTSIKTLVRNTVVIPRDAKQRIASKSVPSQDSKSRGRKRGKSIVSMRKLAEEPEEIQQTASEIFEAKEDLRQENYMSSLVISEITNRRSNVNLRCFTSVSGIYFLDIIFPQPQPRELPNGCTVQIFYDGQDIKRDLYEYNYVMPPLAESNDDPEAPPIVDPGLQHLINIKIPLPVNIMFSENMPIVAQWDKEKKYWSKQHVHHLQINLTTNYATFNIGRTWPFALFINKYSLLPYTKWRLKPKFDVGGVSLLLQCQTIQFEFNVVNFEVCLADVEGLENRAIVEDFLGKYMHLNKLVTIMKNRGLNVFPDEDGFLYVRDSTAKDVVLEDHCNMSIAMLSDSLEFHSCQWNHGYRRRKLAFLVRECLAYNLELRFRVVTTTALSASIYRCNDDETSLDETKVENFGFCPDVSTLLEKAFAHVVTTALNPLQVVAVYNLLSRTKVLSYCGFSRKETTSSSSDTSKRSPKKRGKKTGIKPPGKWIKSPGSRSSNTSGSVLNIPEN